MHELFRHTVHTTLTIAVRTASSIWFVPTPLLHGCDDRSCFPLRRLLPERFRSRCEWEEGAQSLLMWPESLYYGYANVLNEMIFVCLLCVCFLISSRLHVPVWFAYCVCVFKCVCLCVCVFVCVCACVCVCVCVCMFVCVCVSVYCYTIYIYSYGYPEG